MAVDGFQHFCRHFSWSVEPQRSVHPSINCASKILLLTYLLTYLFPSMLLLKQAVSWLHSTVLREFTSAPSETLWTA